MPCDGGGLSAAAFVMAEASPDTKVYFAEPTLFDDIRRSLMAVECAANPKGRRTIRYAIITPVPGELTFSANRDLLAGGVVAADDEVRDTMRFTFAHFRIVAKPGAVIGLAANLNGQVPIKGRTVTTVVTDGNIGATCFARSAPASVAALIGVQMIAAVLATWYFRWMLEDPADA